MRRRRTRIAGLARASGASGHPSERSERSPERAEGERSPERAERALTPIATVTFEVDVTRALAAGPGLAAAVVAAAGALLPAYPELNGAWGEELAVLRRRVHIALGEPGDEGLRWALVRDAGDLRPRGVARALGAGARGEATFAVVAMGPEAGWQSAAPPLPGTSAALSLGAPARRAVAWGDDVVVRAVATLTLSYDARLVDQRRAAAFLRDLRAHLEGPRAPALAGPVL